MRVAPSLIAFLLVAGAGGIAFADDVSPPRFGASYREARTWHEQFLRGEPTKAERLEAMRTLIRASRFGDRGLDRIYRNFEGRYVIDPRIPGVEKTALLQMSGSTSQTKGYRRELLYATAFHNDPRFSLEAMNRPAGNTDEDLVVRHRRTGLYGRIEVKEYSLKSQVTNVEKLKTQIDKMAAAGRATGRPQFWINRYEVSPAIQEFAAKRGVVTIGNVKTGAAIGPGAISYAQASDLVSREFERVGRAGTIAGGAQAAFGAIILVRSTSDLWNTAQSMGGPSDWDTGDWLLVAQRGAGVLSGASFTAAGSALLMRPLAPEWLQNRLASMGRWGAIGGIASFGASEAVSVGRLIRGDVNSREFWTEQWIFGTAAAGGFGGSAAGKLIDLLPWKVPGLSSLASVAGGLAGGWVGHKFGQLTAEEYYNRRFAELDAAFGRAVNDMYRVE